MLSKEEIENMKKYLNECISKDIIYEEDLTLNYMQISKEYMNYLESREQKLIHELEYALKDIQEDKKINDLSMNLGELKINLRCYSVEEIELFITSILKILKGENDE